MNLHFKPIWIFFSLDHSSRRYLAMEGTSSIIHFNALHTFLIYFESSCLTRPTISHTILLLRIIFKLFIFR